MTTSTQRIASVAVAVAIAMILGWYFILWSPQTHDLKSAHQARAAAEQQINQLDSQVSQLDVLVKQIPADTARLKALDNTLPDNPSLDSALDQLHQTAAQTGVLLSSLDPSTPESGSSATPAPGGPAITLGMTATGSYRQLMGFLTDLARMPRALTVDDLTLSGSPELTANITARIFYAGSPTP